MSDVFIELCAGSAALALSLGESVPPVPIMGNKRNYAKQIFEALGVSMTNIKRVILVEPGEWGRTLMAMFFDPHAVADHLESWVTCQKIAKEGMAKCSDEDGT